MPMHKVLSRQLARYQLNENECPSDLKQWHNFLKRISLSYEQQDQDRYLAARTQEISSKEMQELMELLEHSHKVAQLGIWSLDLDTKKFELSKEAYHIFGVDYRQPFLLYNDFLSIIHPNFRALLNDIIFKENKSSSVDLKITVGSEEHWIQLIKDPSSKKTNSKKISGVILNTTQLKKAQEKEIELSKQLIVTARQVGMAEVATSVLHNIGNLLNSVNVAVAVLKERISQSKLRNLTKLVNIYHEHANDLVNFITNDPKGPYFFSYLDKLVLWWQKEQAELNKECKSISQNVDNIKNVIMMQQSLARVSGLFELHDINNITDEALQLCSYSFKSNDIDIIREYYVKQKFMFDKTKVQQILVNLIQNAKDALIDYKDNHDKRLILRTTETDETINVEVEDNGIGMNDTKLKKIFTFGFTTKKSGHGFGLHSGWLAAKEMNAKLIAKSEGLYQGATFSLILPKILKMPKDN